MKSKFHDGDFVDATAEGTSITVRGVVSAVLSDDYIRVRYPSESGAFFVLDYRRAEEGLWVDQVTGEEVRFSRVYYDEESNLKLLHEFAAWLLREHTVVTGWTNTGEPNEQYEHADQMIGDFLKTQMRKEN